MSAYVEMDEHFKTTLGRDVADMVIGKSIAIGSTRAVYEHAHDSSIVVKLESLANSFCNVYEHQVWEHIRDTEFAKWFAPVVRISACGCVLFMERTQPLRREELPTHVPTFFTDLKTENFGLLNGRIVCHDYGFHRFIERGMSKKLRKADWDE